MAFYNSGGLSLHYLDEGTGAPVVLVHGFGSNARYNWGVTGWIQFLAAHHHWVIAPDWRGHGMSDKPHDRAAYAPGEMSRDVVRLLDHLGIRRAFLAGYSMGARICLELLLAYPERCGAVVLGGIGVGGVVTDERRRKAIVDALLAEDKSQVTAESPRLFREFAEAQHNDLKALAACMEAEPAPIDPVRLETVTVPVLIVAGGRDTLIGSAEALSEMIPGSRLLVLDGRDHLNAPGDRRFKKAVLEFFAAASTS